MIDTYVTVTNLLCFLFVLFVWTSFWEERLSLADLNDKKGNQLEHK